MTPFWKEHSSIGLHQKKKRAQKERNHVHFHFPPLLGVGCPLCPIFGFAWTLGPLSLSLSLCTFIFPLGWVGVSFNAACQGFIIQFA